MTDLQSLVNSSAYNTIELTDLETWLSDSILDLEILPAGYTVYRLDRPNSGGGILLAVDETILSQQLSSPSNLELLLIRISLHHPINICLVYNPPMPVLNIMRSQLYTVASYQLLTSYLNGQLQCTRY